MPALPAARPPEVVRIARALVMPVAHLISDFYLIYGILGLLQTGFDFFSNVTGITLLGFTINPLTNCIHVGVGVVGIAMAASPRGARRFLLLIGALGVPFAIAGFLLDGSMSDYFATNTPINALHLGTACAALLVALTARGPMSGDRRLVLARRYIPEVELAPEVDADRDVPAGTGPGGVPTL